MIKHFTISTSETGEYKVSIPEYYGGDVYRKEDVDRKIEELNLKIAELHSLAIIQNNVLDMMTEELCEG